MYEFICYRCGQAGHTRARCPDAQGFPPAPPEGAPEATYTPPRFTASHHQPDPPSAAYLQAKDRLGIPGDGPVLTVACPWCEAGPYRGCVNPGTGKTKRTHHDARLRAYQAAHA